MTIKLPKINSNNLFAPSLLLALLAISFYVTRLTFKDPYNTYSIILTVSSVFVIVKAFILSFVGFEANIANKKWFLVSGDIILTMVQFVAAWSASTFLTQDSYPQTTLAWLLIANIAFTLELFLGRVFELMRVSVISILIYSIIYGILYINPFPAGETRLFVTSLQIVGYITLFLEGIIFFQIVRKYVTR